MKFRSSGAIKLRKTVSRPPGEHQTLVKDKAERIEEFGPKFNVTIPIEGIGAKAGKVRNAIIGWVDNRAKDPARRGETESTLSLSTIIPQGEKK